MAENRTYTGFNSTVPQGKQFDEDLIVTDLLNHFNTRQGERVMDPEYGSIVWDLPFEFKSDFVKNEIQRDSIRIIETEPRVNLEKIEIFELDHGYVVEILIAFKNFGTVRSLRISFNQKIRQNR